jgi:hypothetical protein
MSGWIETELAENQLADRAACEAPGSPPRAVERADRQQYPASLPRVGRDASRLSVSR